MLLPVKNTAKSITLTASDSDANKLTYSITKQPAHGTLTGTIPVLTYNLPQVIRGLTVSPLR